MMKYIFVIISFIIFIYINIRLKKYIVPYIISGISGISVLFLINQFIHINNIYLPYNIFTIVLSFIGGIPGVITMIILQLI